MKVALQAGTPIVPTYLLGQSQVRAAWWNKDILIEAMARQPAARCSLGPKGSHTAVRLGPWYTLSTSCPAASISM